MASELLTRPHWRVRARGHLSLARISNSPTVLTNVLAGAALGGALTPALNTWLLAAALILFYTAGMYLNDLLDFEIDVRERPERPLPSGLISRSEATAVTLGLILLGLGLLALVSTASLLWGVVLLALIAAYDRWHKANPLSPLLMASTRMLVYITAFAAFQPSLTPSLLLWASLTGLYTVGLTYIAKTERRRDLARFWPAALLFLPAAVFAFQLAALNSPGWALLLMLGFVAWVGYSLTFLYVPARRDVGRTVGHLIAGMALIDALVLSRQGAPAAVTLLALAAFALTLLWQRTIKGT